MVYNNVDFEYLYLTITIVGITLQIENRNGWGDYGILNNAEILSYINDADGDYWDAIILGYNDKLSYGNEYNTGDILGIVYIPTGNHKIVLKIPDLDNFDDTLYKKELNKYIANYKKERNIENVLYISKENINWLLLNNYNWLFNITNKYFNPLLQAALCRDGELIGVLMDSRAYWNDDVTNACEIDNWYDTYLNNLE